MTISDKSIEVAARALRHQDEGEGAFDNLPKHQKEQDKNRAEIIIEAYLAAERTQGRDWTAIEKLLPYLSIIQSGLDHAIETAVNKEFEKKLNLASAAFNRFRAAIRKSE